MRRQLEGQVVADAQQELGLCCVRGIQDPAGEALLQCLDQALVGLAVAPFTLENQALARFAEEHSLWVLRVL